MIVFVLSAVLAFDAPSLSPDDTAFFETKVRPVLVEHCLSCHGDKAKGGLRLDSRAAVEKGGDSGPVIEPGKPAESRFIEAIRYDDPDLKMPPKGKLPDAAIADLTAWVARGAPDPRVETPKPKASAEVFDLAARRARHWSFRAVRDQVVPQVHRSDWVRNPIDAFLLKSLENAGLAPAPDADRRTLIRRVTFDLIGLPPTPEEVEAFVREPAPEDQAWAKVVDRLLASPHYGERWARHWLDLVRYGETAGHEFDFDLPNAWRYRDYVIDAFNADLPYDRFVREQVAGDLLESPRRDPNDGTNLSIVGTGLFWLGESKHSPVDLREDQAVRLDNQIDVLGKTFLGLTISCARCHDHKFDPIGTADYYALFGILASTRHQDAPIDDPATTRAVIESLRKLDAEYRDRALTAMPDPSKSDEIACGPDPFAGWTTVGTAFDLTPTLRCEPAVVVSGGSVGGVRRRRIEGVVDSGRDSAQLRGALRSPDFDLTKPHLWIPLAGEGKDLRVSVIIDGFFRIQAPIYGGLRFAPRSSDRLTWHHVDVSMWLGHRAYIEVIDDGDGWIAVGAPTFRDEPPSGSEGPEGLRREVAGPEPFWREWAERRNLLEAKLTKPRQALAALDGTPRDEPIHLRGNAKTLGPKVPRRFLEALGGTESSVPSTGSGRLEWAERLTDPSNPLTARVLANRVWHHHFGVGLVPTPDDFGVMGQPPSHPELLDWLAKRFVAEGWSIKALHRLMLNSHAYRMSSRADDPQAETADPTNRLLHRMRPRRLEAEAIRDAMLTVSGRLDPKLHGPSVPPFLNEHMTGRGRPGTSGPLDGAGRRSIYINVRRNFLTPMFTAFDYPVPFTTIGRRTVSNVPAQALCLMNNPFVVEQAKLWARRTQATPGDNAERVDRLYLQAFARPPDADERAAALAFLGDAPESRWADLCHALFNVKEFLFVP